MSKLVEVKNSDSLVASESDGLLKQLQDKGFDVVDEIANQWKELKDHDWENSLHSENDGLKFRANWLMDVANIIQQSQKTSSKAIGGKTGSVNVLINNPAK